MVGKERKQGENDEEGSRNPPLSHAEELIQAHPDITAIRDTVNSIRITQTFPDRRRRIDVFVAHDEDSNQQNPSVILHAHTTETERSLYDFAQYGFTTIVSVHVEDDGHVTPEIGYRGGGHMYPTWFDKRLMQRAEMYAAPVPAQELVTATRTGLEMLRAYDEATPEQRGRIDKMRTGYHGWSQIVADTRPNIGAYIANASPILAAIVQERGMSPNFASTKTIYALNTLNKVTDTMLPGEMPPAPQNKREPQNRATNAPAARRRPAGQ